MDKLCTDTGYVSLNKKGEQLCGDRVEIIARNDNSLTLVLADGLGSGVKANILSTLTSKILSTMIENGMPIEECVDTIVKTLPVCSVRKVAYSTFTIIHVEENTTATLIQFDNPNVILLRGGKHWDYPTTSRVIEGKTILESKFPLQLNDMMIAMSDGAIWAGVGQSMNFGWQRDNVVEFAERMYEDTLSAKMMAALIVDECNRLYAGEPGDDTTVAAVRVRERKPVNLMIGPPADPADVGKMMACFLPKRAKNCVRRHHLEAGGKLFARGCGDKPGLWHRPGHSPHRHHQGRRPCNRGRYHPFARGGICQCVLKQQRSCQLVEPADGRRLAHCAVSV